jgi:hypothetical protein
MAIRYRKLPGHQTGMTKIKPLCGINNLHREKGKNSEGCKTEKVSNI